VPIFRENGTMKVRGVFLIAFGVMAMALSALAQDVSGQWTATFNTQIGEQHYSYTFKVDGDKLTGTPKDDRGTTEIANGTFKGDDFTFVENLNINGKDIANTYKG
jgi:hypothetical protein